MNGVQAKKEKHAILRVRRAFDASRSAGLILRATTRPSESGIVQRSLRALATSETNRQNRQSHGCLCPWGCSALALDHVRPASAAIMPPGTSDNATKERGNGEGVASGAPVEGVEGDAAAADPCLGPWMVVVHGGSLGRRGWMTQRRRRLSQPSLQSPIQT